MAHSHFVFHLGLDSRVHKVDDNGWFYRGVVTCDLCNYAASYFHPDGGVRCSGCVRPMKKEDKITMAKISDFSDEQLKEELKRREAVRVAPVLPNPDFTKVIKIVTENVMAKASGVHNRDDGFLWEAAMEAVYGPTVWTWYSKLP